jgi:hypothetical protein
VFNTASLMLKAALEGFGLAYFTEQQVSRDRSFEPLATIWVELSRSA